MPSSTSIDSPEPVDLAEQRRSRRARGGWLIAAAAVIVAVVAVGAVLVLSDRDGTTGIATNPTSSTSTAPTSTSPSTSLEASVADLTYPSQWSPTGEIDLVDGAWEGQPIDGGVTVTTAMVFAVATGALGEDSVDDAAVVLVIDGGGSGTFYDLYVVDGAALAVTGPAPLGDRIEGLDLTITPDREVTAEYTRRDGQSARRRYLLVDGALDRLDAPFPLVGPYLDSACQIAGESDATIDYLDHTSTLVACNETDSDEFIANHGGTLVDVIDGYALISLPTEDEEDTSTIFEVTVPSGFTSFLEGTCLVEEDVLSGQGSSTNPDGDIAETVELTATITTETGTVTYADLEATYTGTITSIDLGPDRFEASYTTSNDETLTVAGRCWGAAPDSDRFDVPSVAEIAAAIGDPDIDRFAVVDLNDDEHVDVIAVMSGSNWCGSGGCTAFTVLADTTGILTRDSRITLVAGDILLGPINNGWHDLIVETKEGYTTLTRDADAYPLNPTTAPPADPTTGTELTWNPTP